MELILRFIMEVSITNTIPIVLTGWLMASVVGNFLKKTETKAYIRILVYSIAGTIGGVASYMAFDIPERQLELLDLALIVPGMMTLSLVLFAPTVLLSNRPTKQPVSDDATQD